MSETKSTLTMTEAKLAKTVLEKEIARLIKEFGDICDCEIRMIHITSLVWGANEQRPLDYRVEVEAKL